MKMTCRFGRIVHINGEDERVHVQWFDHASNTFLDNIANPRELFLTPLCDTLPLIIVYGTDLKQTAAKAEINSSRRTRTSLRTMRRAN